MDSHLGLENPPLILSSEYIGPAWDRDLADREYTTDYPAADCEACIAGKCLQKLLTCPVWANDIVVHDCGCELN